MSQERRVLPDLANATWRTSSYSGGQGECVEVGHNLPHLVPVRDSKRPLKPRHRLRPRRLARVRQRAGLTSDSHARVVPDASGTTRSITCFYRTTVTPGDCAATSLLGWRVGTSSGRGDS